MLKLVRQDVMIYTIKSFLEVSSCFLLVMNKEEFSEVALVICPFIFLNKAI